MDRNRKRRAAALGRELRAVEKQEKKMERAALKAKPATWKNELENLIPQKVYTGLVRTFCKGFGLVFNQGKAIIEKGYNRENIRADHAIRDYAVQVKGGRKELKKIHKSAKKSDLLNLAVTTVEGVGLGALGVGMPDIVLFLANLLKGVYETALNYGFDYESLQDRILILRMLQASLSTGEEWAVHNAQVDALLTGQTPDFTEEDFQAQLRETASAFAMDMLLLKFLQGLPVVGILGGAANPVYYSKVMKYVQLKYRKGYLLKQKTEE